MGKFLAVAVTKKNVKIGGSMDKKRLFDIKEFNSKPTFTAQEEIKQA